MLDGLELPEPDDEPEDDAPDDEPEDDEPDDEPEAEYVIVMELMFFLPDDELL